MYQIERTSRLYLQDAAGQYRIPSSAQGSNTFGKNKGNFVLKRMNKLGKKADAFVNGVHEHVRLGPKITETVKGKLSLGARILQVGGVDKVFKQLFSVGEGEKLMKACQCYLSTTAGPLAGLLFISSEKVAFCSDRSIKIPSPNGEFLRVHYKVLIPLEKIKGVNESENMKKPSQKYMEIVTVDGFDFWFMGWLIITLNYMNKDRRRSTFHNISTVGNGDISNGAEAGGSFRKLDKQTPQHPAAPAGAGMYGVPTLAHVIYRVRRFPVPGAVNIILVVCKHKQILCLSFV
ncbi:hypothetical protein V6N11_072392 [Hibiscus sabdariffa]|uniref:GRAM domain-containing protein n=1 Tax=Hibiscus sabdariffa TaxID=183260 RepID=A0ABR2U364_9ROSI